MALPLLPLAVANISAPPALNLASTFKPLVYLSFFGWGVIIGIASVLLNWALYFIFLCTLYIYIIIYSTRIIQSSFDHAYSFILSPSTDSAAGPPCLFLLLTVASQTNVWTFPQLERKGSKYPISDLSLTAASLNKWHFVIEFAWVRPVSQTLADWAGPGVGTAFVCQ